MSDYKVITVFTLFVSFFLLSISTLVSDGIGYRLSEKAQDFVAGTFFKQSVSHDELRERYEIVLNDDKKELRKRRRQGLSNEPIKVLIVPGHDDKSIGAAFGDIKEVDLNRKLSKELFNFLDGEEGFSVKLASDENGYDKELLKYFDKEEIEIRYFKDEYKQKMNKLVQAGKVDFNVGVFHNSAPDDVVFKLYGINKWVNDNKYDIVIHVHFNDYPGRKSGQFGKYSGYSIYVPEKQFSNARASKEFANFLFKQLGNVIPVSDLPGEADGVIEDQELIAIGSYNTVDAVSVLVEYGYIYESVYTQPDVREAMLKELAFQTYQGIKNFFNEVPVTKETTLINEFITDRTLKEGTDYKLSILGLQNFLRLEGLYPPPGKSFNECPLSGFFGECTKEALEIFQTKNNLQPTGILGPVTKDIVERKIKNI